MDEEGYETDDEPVLLELVSTEVAVTLYSKTFPTLDRSNVNFNDIYEEFSHVLARIVATKTKQPIEVIEAADKVITWK